jgi:hypothetical protein
MDFPKFVYLLTTRRLYCSRIDRLEDAWEGWYPAAPMQSSADSQDEAERTISLHGLARFLEQFRREIFVNCWHMGRQESAAMWKIYTLLGQGIAIRSTVGRLKESLARTPEQVFVGEVAYGPFETPNLAGGGNRLAAACVKRLQFDYERELRALIWSILPVDGPAESREWDPNVEHHQLELRIDLDQLIEGVVLAPRFFDSWNKPVGSLLSTYGLPLTPERSSIDQPHPLLEAMNRVLAESELIRSFDSVAECCRRLVGGPKGDGVADFLQSCQGAQAYLHAYGVDHPMVPTLRARAEAKLKELRDLEDRIESQRQPSQE